jgi:hypothetical protein
VLKAYGVVRTIQVFSFHLRPLQGCNIITTQCERDDILMRKPCAG